MSAKTIVKEQSIIDGNLLMAKFLGWYKGNNETYTLKVPQEYWHYREFQDKSSETYYTIVQPTIYTLKFHEDWNWLIPVLKKLEEEIGVAVFYSLDIESIYWELIEDIKNIKKYDTYYR